MSTTIAHTEATSSATAQVQGIQGITRQLIVIVITAKYLAVMVLFSEDFGILDYLPRTLRVPLCSVR